MNLSKLGSSQGPHWGFRCECTGIRSRATVQLYPWYMLMDLATGQWSPDAPLNSHVPFCFFDGSGRRDRTHVDNQDGMAWTDGTDVDERGERGRPLG